MWQIAWVPLVRVYARNPVTQSHANLVLRCANCVAVFFAKFKVSVEARLGVDIRVEKYAQIQHVEDEGWGDATHRVARGASQLRQALRAMHRRHAGCCSNGQKAVYI